MNWLAQTPSQTDEDWRSCSKHARIGDVHKCLWPLYQGWSKSTPCSDLGSNGLMGPALLGVYQASPSPHSWHFFELSLPKGLCRLLIARLARPATWWLTIHVCLPKKVRATWGPRPSHTRLIDIRVERTGGAIKLAASQLLVAPGIATGNKRLLVTRAFLLGAIGSYEHSSLALQVNLPCAPSTHRWAQAMWSCDLYKASSVHLRHAHLPQMPLAQPCEGGKGIRQLHPDSSGCQSLSTEE